MAIIKKATIDPMVEQLGHRECSNDPKSMVAVFEKVSKEEFIQAALKNRCFQSYILFNPGMSDQEFKDYLSSWYDTEDFIPRRSTSNSAGYDFFCPFDLHIYEYPVLVPTGIKCKIEDGYTLDLYPRSSMGINRGLMLMNTVGIIDSDYYNNEKNEGHIFVSLGLSNRYCEVIKPMERFVQGIFHPYYTAGNDATNPLLNTERKGGMGSTGL